MTVINIPTEATHQRVAAALERIALAQSGDAVKTWAGLSRMSRNGFASQILRIGDIISEKWTDKAPATPVEYEHPWGVRHFGTFDLQDGTTTPGVVLQTQYATLKGVMFCRSKAFYKCTEVLAAGTYHFNTGPYSTSNFGNKDVQFTLTQATEVGDRLSLQNAPCDTSSANWKVTVYKKDGKTKREEVVTTIGGTDGTDLGTLLENKRSGNLCSGQEVCHGHNRWDTSAYRQYLNSAAGVNAWWEPKDGWDVAPDQLATIPGFLSGLPDDMIAAMRKVRTRTYLNTVNDTAEAGVQYIDTYDRVFLPSLNQMYISPQITDEGDSWDYWKAVALGAGFAGKFPTGRDIPALKNYAVENHASSQHVWLRSAYRGYACYPWYVNSSGGVYSNSARNSFRCVPACVI